MVMLLISSPLKCSVMNFKLNVSSFLLGIICILAVGILFSARDPQSDDLMGKYRAYTNEEGFLILDTQSGKYILETDDGYIGNQRLIRGDFESSFAAGRDLFSKK
jgi:hypothetical protein